MKFYNLLVGLFISIGTGIFLGYVYKTPNASFEAQIILGKALVKRDTMIEVMRNTSDFSSLQYFNFNYYIFIATVVFITFIFLWIKPLTLIKKKQLFAFLGD